MRVYQVDGKSLVRSTVHGQNSFHTFARNVVDELILLLQNGREIDTQILSVNSLDGVTGQSAGGCRKRTKKRKVEDKKMKGN